MKMNVFSVKACDRTIPEANIIESLLTQFLKTNTVETGSDISNYLNPVIKKIFHENSRSNVSTLSYKDNTDKAYHVYIQITRTSIQPMPYTLFPGNIRFWIVVNQRYHFFYFIENSLMRQVVERINAKNDDCFKEITITAKYQCFQGCRASAVLQCCRNIFSTHSLPLERRYSAALEVYK